SHVRSRARHARVEGGGAVGARLGPGTLSGPQSVSRVRVRYAETDKMGVVYYANYFVWFEVGRTDLLRETGSTYRDLESDGITLPVIEAHCEYLRSAHYDDDLEIHTLGTLLSPVRVEFAYQVIRAAEPTLIATG